MLVREAKCCRAKWWNVIKTKKSQMKQALICKCILTLWEHRCKKVRMCLQKYFTSLWWVRGVHSALSTFCSFSPFGSGLYIAVISARSRFCLLLWLPATERIFYIRVDTILRLSGELSLGIYVHTISSQDFGSLSFHISFHWQLLELRNYSIIFREIATFTSKLSYSTFISFLKSEIKAMQCFKTFL